MKNESLPIPDGFRVTQLPPSTPVPAPKVHRAALIRRSLGDIFKQIPRPAGWSHDCQHDHGCKCEGESL